VVSSHCCYLTDQTLEHYDLKVDDWKQDIQPEFIDGHNIADWVDPDVLHKLDELDREEDERIAKLAEQTAEDDGDDVR